MSGFDELKTVLSNIVSEKIDSSKNIFLCTVKSTDPLIVNSFVLGDIQEKNLSILYATRRRIKEDINIQNNNGYIKKIPFSIGDKVMLCVLENGDTQHFVIIDKVVGL